MYIHKTQQWGGAHRGKGEGMPLEECYRGDIDKDILSSLSKEPFPSHLDLKRLGRMLHHFYYDHIAQATNESNDPFNNIDNESTQHVLP